MIEPAVAGDFPAILSIYRRILQKGEAYSYPADLAEDDIRDYWMGEGMQCFVAKQDGKIAGAYVLKPNRAGRGSHVANASYVVDETFRGRGIGRALGEHSIQQAKKSGFQALQFNYVVSANEAAVSLWKSLGFTVVGTVPKGFQHSTKGLVDVYIMHRFL